MTNFERVTASPEGAGSVRTPDCCGECPYSARCWKKDDCPEWYEWFTSMWRGIQHIAGIWNRTG